MSLKFLLFILTLFLLISLLLFNYLAFFLFLYLHNLLFDGRNLLFLFTLTLGHSVDRVILTDGKGILDFKGLVHGRNHFVRLFLH